MQTFVVFRHPRRLIAALAALMLAAPLFSPVQASAQSQNEVLTTVLYDGTRFDADPADDGVGGHTPGLDASENNLVVKTHDQFAVRVDWNVNEDAATAVFLEVVLPAFAEWNPDATGMFAGCDPALSSFPNPQTLLCSLGDQIEGSNGTIRPIATLNLSTDGTPFDVVSTLTTGQDAAGVTDGLDAPLVVSEAPITNFIKAEPEISERVSTSSGDEGYVFMYTIVLHDFSQGPNPRLGAGAINDALPINFFDHAFDITSSATLASVDQLTAGGFAGRTACGAYDGTDAFPVTVGTWTCGAETNPNGYAVVPITIDPYSTVPLLPNADGSANASVVQAGQIAFWVPAAEVDAKIAAPDNPSAIAAQFDNAIADQDDSAVITDQADVDPIQVPGGSGSYFDETQTVSPPGDAPADNVSRGFLGASTVSGGPGARIGHDIRFLPGPLQILETYRYDDGATPRHSADLRIVNQGGLFLLPGAGAVIADTTNGDRIGTTPRGATLTINSQVLSAATNPAVLYDAKIQGCTAFDTTHYNLSAFGSIPVTQTDGVSFNNPAVTGGYTTTSNTGPLAHVYTGAADSLYIAGRGQHSSVGGIKAGLDYTVEFTNAPLQLVGTAFGVNDDELTCNDSDAGSFGWVDAATGNLAQFDADGDGLYEGITRARIRITENFPWAPDDSIGPDNQNFYTGFQAYFQASVLTDLSVQTADQELFALQSHSFGDLGPDGVPDLVPYDGQASLGHCAPYQFSHWEANGNLIATSTGYCNNSFVDDGANSLDTSDAIDWDDSSGTRATPAATILNSSGTVVSIVEAALGITKSNNAGLGDIKNNGQLVEFTISPRVIGSTQEALTNVTLSDNLPANYHFVQFLSLPTSPGATCTPPSTPDGTITCQFSEPNPSVDTGPLPAGLPGGWSDSFQIQVEVVGAVADPDSAVVITNTATVASDGLGPWDPNTDEFVGDVQAATKSARNSANSFLPLPADQGAIIKTVDTLEGACNTHPLVDPAPADWADRCSEIGYNDDMSFVLSLTNEGNTEFTNIEIVDVFPHNGDGVEPASNTSNQGSSLPNTLGDGRDPASDFAGTLGFLSVDPVANATGLVTWVTADPSISISRDPDVTVGLAANTWCDGINGAIEVTGTTGPGTCPTTPEEVTATYSVIPGALAPGDTAEIRLNLDSEGVECDDHWTNTFGARVDQILLPIRSNDVTIMVQCEYDLALDKTIDPAFVPGADWVTPGVTTIDFLIEVINQGDPVEDFHVTDYVDTSVFTFDPANTATTATTAAGTVLPMVWDTTDPAAPVAMVDGPLAPGESVFIPVTLIVEDQSGPLNNLAEISYFDSDGDPSNGDSDPDNPNNPSSGPLTDVDSIPDDDVANDPQPTGPGAPGDGVVIGTGGGLHPIRGDEDDHDIAGIPVYDLELIKTAASPAVDFTTAPPTATYLLTVNNQGNADVFLVDVTDYGAPGLTYDAAATAATLPAGVTDANPTFTIDTIPAGGSVTIPVVYQITDLSEAPYTNAAEISAFDSDADPDNAPDPFAVDMDSTPDDVNDDDVIDHNESNYDPDGDGNVNGPTPGDEDDHDVETIDPFASLEPGVDIEKATNGVQSDEAPGELIAAGDPVTWTYVVTNTGATALANATVTDSQGVVVDCDVDGDGVLDGTNVIPFLAVAGSVTCEGTGIATPGPYTNNSSVSGDPIIPDWLSCGCDPLDPATWPTDPAGYVPAVGADGEPQAPVTDADASHYTGLIPGAAIDIEKSTNLVDSDEAPGETINVGEAVTWTYVVTNTGSLALTDAAVTDSQGVIVDCDIDGDGVLDGTNIIPLMIPGASVTCEGTGVAVDGPYDNVGDVSGAPAIPDFATCGCDPNDPSTWPTDAASYDPPLDENGDPLAPVTDADASHYTGFTPVYDLALEKTLAEGQATTGLAIGDDVTFTITVVNQGNVDATDVEVIDYIPAGLVLNDSDWTSQGADSATTTIPGVIAAGTSATVDVTMTITAAGDLANHAEITESTAIDTNGVAFLDPAGNPLADIDSVADELNSDVLSDGVLNGDGGDEDDHDVANISVAAAAPAPPSTIAFTGQSSTTLAGFAFLMLIAGMATVTIAGRRKEARPTQ